MLIINYKNDIDLLFKLYKWTSINSDIRFVHSTTQSDNIYLNLKGSIEVFINKMLYIHLYYINYLNLHSYNIFWSLMSNIS